MSRPARVLRARTGAAVVPTRAAPPYPKTIRLVRRGGFASVATISGPAFIFRPPQCHTVNLSFG